MFAVRIFTLQSFIDLLRFSFRMIRMVIFKYTENDPNRTKVMAYPLSLPKSLYESQIDLSAKEFDCQHDALA